MQNYLPEPLLSHIDLASMAIEKDSFIENELKESHADLLFKTTFSGQTGYIYFLFEHKSYASSLTPVQLLKYMCQIWESKQIKEKQYPLPVILPIVFYHGKRRWNIGERLADMLDDNVPIEFGEYIPDYQYILYDLSHFSTEDIRGNARLCIFMEILRTIHRSDGEFTEGFRRALESMRDLEMQTTGMGYFETCVRYIMNVRQNVTLEEIYGLTKSALAEGGEMIMTIAEQLVEKGRQEGKINILIKQLTKKLGELPPHIQSQLHKASPIIIDHLIEDIFEVESIADVEKRLH